MANVSQWISYSGQETDEFSGGIATLSNGDIATAFTVKGIGGESRVIVQRLTMNGGLIWSININADYSPSAGSVLVGSDDTIYVVGGTKKGVSGESGRNDSDVYAAAVTANGQIAWYRNYGIGLHEVGAKAVLDAQGNIVLIGRVSEVNDDYVQLQNASNFYGAEYSDGWRGFQLKIDPSNGEVNRAYTTGSSNSGGDYIAIDKIRNTAFVSGYTFDAVNGVRTIGNGDPAGANKYLIARNETTGSIQWTRMEKWIRSNIVVQENEDAIYFVDKGELKKVAGSSGKTLWTKNIEDTDYVLSPIAGGGILLSENKSKNGVLRIRKFNSSGNEEESQEITHTGDLYPHSFLEQGDGRILISGSATGIITSQEKVSVRSEKQSGQDSFLLELASAFSSHPITRSPIIRGNSLYTIVEGPSWTQAEANSVALGGHLVSISSADEQDFIWSQFQAYGFIGLTDEVEEGIWRWTDGTIYSYSNWSPGNPNNSIGPGGISQDYAVMGWSLAPVPGQWDDQWDQQVIEGLLGIAEIPLQLTIDLPETPTEGTGVFTTSINLSAGTGSSGNLAEGTQVFWKITGITADDLASGALTGQGTITNGSLDIEHSLVKDTDSGEVFEVSVFSDAEMSQQIGTTSSVSIQEGDPVVPALPVLRGNSLYTIVDGPSWTQAEANSVALGGHLVAINTEDENDFIWKEYSNPEKYLMRPNDPNAPGIFSHWIGLTDTEEEGSWGWSTGEALTFSSPLWGTLEGNYNTEENWARVTWNVPEEWLGSVTARGYWQDHNEYAFKNGNETPTGIAEIPLQLSIEIPETPTEGTGVFTTSINLSAGTGSSGNLAEGTQVFWKVSGITAEDLASGALTGSGIITGGKLSLQHSLVKDNDKGEQFEISVYSDASRTQQIGSTANFSILEATNTVPGIQVSGGQIFTGEGGDSVEYSFVLDTKPTDPVTLTFNLSDSSEAALSKSRITFSTDNWNIPQVLTISGLDDFEDDGDIGYVVTTRVTSLDPDYGQRKDGTGGIKIDNLQLVNKDDGLDKDQTIYGDNEGTGIVNDLLRGGNGRDRIYGLLGRDRIYGSRNNDRLYGGIDDDYLYGEEGDDELYGEQDDDELFGGDGNDRLIGGEGIDYLYGGPGNDIYIIDDELDIIDDQGLDTDIDTVVIRGSITSYTLPNGINNGTLDGTDGQDLNGNSEDNELIGNDNDNRIRGGLGNDVIYSGDGDDDVFGEAGSDTIIGGDGRGDDNYDGGSGLDTIVYSSAVKKGIVVDLRKGIASGVDIGNDTLTRIENVTGGKKDDVILGSNRRNIIIGGLGSDELTGLRGKDIFRYLSVAESTFSLNGRDTLTDFNGKKGDRIDLSAMDANTKLQGIQAFRFVESKPFTGIAGQISFANGVLSADVDGDKLADFAVNIIGSDSFKGSWLIL